MASASCTASLVGEPCSFIVIFLLKSYERALGTTTHTRTHAYTATEAYLHVCLNESVPENLLCRWSSSGVLHKHPMYIHTQYMAHITQYTHTHTCPYILTAHWHCPLIHNLYTYNATATSNHVAYHGQSIMV